MTLTLLMNLGFGGSGFSGPIYNSSGVPFTYSAANWVGISFYFQVYFRASVGTVRARLWNDTDSTPVGSSDLLTTSSTFVLSQTPVVTLVDGKRYVGQLAKDAGASGEFYGHHLEWIRL